MHWLEEARQILAEAEALEVPYTQHPVPGGLDAVAYVAKQGEWIVTVVRFSIEDQGFPKGSVGYDGAVRKGGTVVHMTRDVAERIFRKVESH